MYAEGSYCNGGTVQKVVLTVPYYQTHCAVCTVYCVPYEFPSSPASSAHSLDINCWCLDRCTPYSCIKGHSCSRPAAKFFQFDDKYRLAVAGEMATKRSRAKASGSEFNSIKMWDQMAWRSVDVAKENLGDYEDTVFFGLEELDGNAYKLMKTDQVSC